jgi:hypothetical protein
VWVDKGVVRFIELKKSEKEIHLKTETRYAQERWREDCQAQGGNYEIVHWGNVEEFLARVLRT